MPEPGSSSTDTVPEPDTVSDTNTITIVPDTTTDPDTTSLASSSSVDTNSSVTSSPFMPNDNKSGWGRQRTWSTGIVSDKNFTFSSYDSKPDSAA